MAKTCKYIPKTVIYLILLSISAPSFSQSYFNSTDKNFFIENISERNVFKIHNEHFGFICVSTILGLGYFDQNSLKVSIINQQSFQTGVPFFIGIILALSLLLFFYRKRNSESKNNQDSKEETTNSLIPESKKILITSNDDKEGINLVAIPMDDDWLVTLNINANSLIEDGKFSIIELASTMNLSERQFRRKFKQKTNLRPADYMREIRLLKAEKLLKNKSLSTVAEVCYAVGFSTPKHFSKIFKERFGENPSFYLDNRRTS